jgi:hypothetical protein
MTPKLKARDLYDQFCNMESWCDDARECALIALRETVWGYLDQQPIEIQNYWKEVKQEINKL